MTLVQFFSILRARWKIMLIVLVTVVLGTGIVNLVLPKKYTASSSVMVDIKSPDPIAGIIFPGMSSPSYMATQVDVIQSDRVAQQVVRSSHMADSTAMRDQWRDATGGEGNFEVWLAEVLGKSLDVKPSRDSNVINLTYKSPDPRFAAAMANAYAQAFIDVSLELRVEPARQYGRFFEERGKQLREKVEQARAKLTAYQRANGITGSDERLDVETARLNELNSQLVILQGLNSDSAARRDQARALGQASPDAIASAQLSNLRMDLTRDEVKLKEVRERLGEAHPDVKMLVASIAELRSRIDAETSRVTGGVSSTDTINQARLRTLTRELDTQRAKVLHLKEARDQIAVLAGDVESAQRAYDAVSVRENQTELEGRTTQTNLYILNPATEPMKPASPRVTLNMLLAIFLGTLLAVAVALLMELFDRRVRSASEVVQALEMPLLGVLARKQTGRLFGRKQLASGKTPAPAPVEPAGLSLGHDLVPAMPAMMGESDASTAPLADAPPHAEAGIGFDTGASTSTADEKNVIRDLALGEIFKETHKLDAAQIETVLAYQREHGVLFGEAAVALKLVEDSDVLWALSRQFHYPYALAGRKQFNPELIAATTPFSSVAETFRSIRSQLMRRAEQDTQRRALAIVSADAGDGKTFVAANLAIAFSQLGRRTLLIDADMRSPRLHKVFGIDNSRGLSSILSGRLSTRILTPVTDLPSLFVLPVGAVPPNPLELLESPAFAALVRELLGKFDHVIIDSPPADVGADAGVIAARSGAFISVARQGRTCMEAMVELVQSLRDSTTLAHGFILNEH